MMMYSLGSIGGAQQSECPKLKGQTVPRVNSEGCILCLSVKHVFSTESISLDLSSQCPFAVGLCILNFFNLFCFIIFPTISYLV